jgi:hypothetical protein
VYYRIEATLVTPGMSYTCEVINLSATGILVLPPVRFCVGARLRVVLPFPGYLEPIQLKGRVVREGEHSGRYALGIGFDLLPVDALVALMNLVAGRNTNRPRQTTSSSPRPERPSKVSRAKRYVTKKPVRREPDIVPVPGDVPQYDEDDLMGILQSRQRLKELYAEALDQLDATGADASIQLYQQRRRSSWG